MPISKTVLGYTQKETHDPLAVDHFLAWTERGIKPPIFLADREAGLDLADLLWAHAVSSRTPHPLLESMWIEGLDDIPLGRLLIDYLTQDKATFLRRRPLFERAYRLHSKAGGRA